MESHTRFIVGSASLKDIRELSNNGIEAIDLLKYNSILIISDFGYFLNKEMAIRKWCHLSLTSWAQSGMILGFVNDEERNLFLMRWA